MAQGLLSWWAFPLLVAPQEPSNKTNPSEGGKRLGGVSSEISPAAEQTRPDPFRSKHDRPKCDPTTGEVQCYDTVVFVAGPIERVSIVQGLIFIRSGRRAGAHTNPAWPKIPSAPSAVPLLGSPQAPGISENSFGPVGISLIRGASGASQYPPPERGKSLGGRPPEAGGNLQCRDTLGWIRDSVNTAGRSATRRLERSSVTTLWYLLLAPPYRHVWHKTFFGGSERLVEAHTGPE